MRVRVGISTRNRRELLAKSIESVLEQDYPNIEIAVIDDASTDGTSTLRDRYPGVVWSRERVQRGQMYTRNRLMSETGADLYVSLDDDAWFLRGDEVSTAVEVMSARADVAVIAFDILSKDQPKQKPRTEPEQVNSFIGCGAVLRLDAVRTAGYYAHVPGIYGSEESDLSIRILDQGDEILKTPGVHVWHDKSNFVADTPWKHRSGVCNDLVFTLRRYPAPQIFWYVPGKILSHLWFALRNGLVGPYLGGVTRFLRSASEALRSRAPVRESTLREYQRRIRST